MWVSVENQHHVSEKHQEVVYRDTCVLASKKCMQTTELGPYRGTKRYSPHISSVTNGENQKEIAAGQPLLLLVRCGATLRDCAVLTHLNTGHGAWRILPQEP